MKERWWVREQRTFSVDFIFFVVEMSSPFLALLAAVEVANTIPLANPIPSAPNHSNATVASPPPAVAAALCFASPPHQAHDDAAPKRSEGAAAAAASEGSVPSDSEVIALRSSLADEFSPNSHQRRHKRLRSPPPSTTPKKRKISFKTGSPPPPPPVNLLANSPMPKRARGRPPTKRIIDFGGGKGSENDVAHDSTNIKKMDELSIMLEEARHWMPNEVTVPSELSFIKVTMATVNDFVIKEQQLPPIIISEKQKIAVGPKKQSLTIPPDQRRMLYEWLCTDEHFRHPYPSTSQKHTFAQIIYDALKIINNPSSSFSSPTKKSSATAAAAASDAAASDDVADGGSDKDDDNDHDDSHDPGSKFNFKRVLNKVGNWFINIRQRIVKPFWFFHWKRYISSPSSSSSSSQQKKISSLIASAPIASASASAPTPPPPPPPPVARS
jgi:hypothetical protein